MNENLELVELEELMLKYCHRHRLPVSREFYRTQWEKDEVTFIITPNGEDDYVGIIVKDWKRAIGVDVVIRAEKIMKNNPLLARVVVVTNASSDPAQALAERIAIPVVIRSDLIKALAIGIETLPTKRVNNQHNGLTWVLG